VHTSRYVQFADVQLADMYLTTGIHDGDALLLLVLVVPVGVCIPIKAHRLTVLVTSARFKCDTYDVVDELAKPLYVVTHICNFVRTHELTSQKLLSEARVNHLNVLPIRANGVAEQGSLPAAGFQ
jgi:hypothetical protein